MIDACHRIDIDGNNKISPYEFHQVCLLLNGTQEANLLQAKLTEEFGKEKQRCDNAGHIFNLMHTGKRREMEMEECFVGLQWLKEQLTLIGPPRVIISNLDG